MLHGGSRRISPICRSYYANVIRDNFDVRFWGQSGHQDFRGRCLLLTQSGLRTAARNTAVSYLLSRRELAAERAARRALPNVGYESEKRVHLASMSHALLQDCGWVYPKRRGAGLVQITAT
jgi:hypothetical protein